MRQQFNRRKGKSKKLLFLSLFSFLSLLLLIFFIPPTFSFLIFGIHISILLFFFPLLALFLFSLPTYFFTSKKHGILLSLFGMLYATLLLSELRHPFFLILLLALFLTLELLFTSKQQTH